MLSFVCDEPRAEGITFVIELIYKLVRIITADVKLEHDLCRRVILPSFISANTNNLVFKVVHNNATQIIGKAVCGLTNAILDFQ